MKINIKQGCRRIVVVLLFLAVILAFINFAKKGFIWNKWKFDKHTHLISTQIPEKEIKSLWESYFPLQNNSCQEGYHRHADEPLYWTLDCYPERYCKVAIYGYRIDKKCYDGVYKDGDVFEVINKKTKKKEKIQIKMPTKKEYFLMQLQDFSLIIVIPCIVYLLYLFLEFLICWIIKGFKS